MTYLAAVLAVVAGAVVGALGVYVVAFSFRKKSEAEMIQEREGLKNQFAALSQDVLGAATEQFLKLAQSRLETERVRQGADLDEKRAAVENAVSGLSDKLKNYEQLVRNFEKDREQKYGSLEAQIRAAVQTTERLQGATENLQSLLSNSRTRGQWGERMAEDILRACGLQEGVQYRRNKAQETVATRPDYTFLLPGGQKLHMDVKFPLDNYMRMANAAKDEERARFKADFLGDAKARVKETTKRDYINPDEMTLDYVLLFIPNEQVYNFLQEADPKLIENAMAQKVILCSPPTLFTTLSIIRQAYDNFHFTRATQQVVSLIQDFRKRFDTFKERFVNLGEALGKTQQVYEEISQTSYKRLEQAVVKIDRVSRGEGKMPEADPLNATLPEPSLPSRISPAALPKTGV